MSATFCRVVNGGALVTACKAVTAVSLSANNVGFGAGVTLSWSGAAGGAGNPIRGYEVYRDGVLLTTVFDGTSCTVTSPTSNGSYKFTVKTLGRIPGFDAPVSTASATLTSKVSAPTAPTSVWLSATDVRIGKSVTLSWSGAAGGANNPVAKYHVYRGGAYLTETTGTSCAVTASGTAGGKYTYTVYSIGSVSGWNSGASVAVTCTAHTAEKTYVAFTSSGDYVVPSWAEQADIAAIGAGGGGSRVGGGYNQYGGSGGGAGYIASVTSAASAGQTLRITVGVSGIEQAGGGSAVYRGGAVLVSANGGGAGRTLTYSDYWTHDQRNPNNAATRAGGDGMAGGGTGGCGTAAEANGHYAKPGGMGTSTTGGWGLSATYGITGAGGGSYKGANGADAKGQAWGGWGGPAAVGANCDDYYPFGDRGCGYYAAARGGNGGAGVGTGTPGGGGYGAVPGGDATGATLRGTAIGAGGNGGSAIDGHNASEPTAGGNGLVIIRLWRYLS